MVFRLHSRDNSVELPKALAACSERRSPFESLTLRLGNLSFSPQSLEAPDPELARGGVGTIFFIGQETSGSRCFCSSLFPVSESEGIVERAPLPSLQKAFDLEPREGGQIAR
jgi:hypothetical protein